MASDDPPVPGCAREACTRDASFRLYDADRRRWTPICEPHAVAVHPSLEVHVLLESGYLKPVELGPPDGPPGEPATGRSAAFREAVEELTGWSVGDGR